jgi:twitching motility protein PilI
MNSQEISPLDIFQQLEQESLGNQLAESEEISGETWRGFIFNIDGIEIVVPFAGEFEIVPMRTLSPLPMAAKWVRGMTNIRGEIYTIVDFSEFIGQRPVRNLKNANLFLLPDSGLKSALLINSRISLRTFSAELPTTSKDAFNTSLAPYLSTVVVDDSTKWGVLDVDLLSKSAQFNQIGR